MKKTKQSVPFKDIMDEIKKNGGEYSVNALCAKLFNRVPDEIAARSLITLSNGYKRDNIKNRIRNDFGAIMEAKVYNVKVKIYELVYQKKLVYTDNTKKSVKIP